MTFNRHYEILPRISNFCSLPPAYADDTTFRRASQRQRGSHAEEEDKVLLVTICCNLCLGVVPRKSSCIHKHSHAKIDPQEYIAPFVSILLWNISISETTWQHAHWYQYFLFGKSKECLVYSSLWCALFKTPCCCIADLTSSGGAAGNEGLGAFSICLDWAYVGSGGGPIGALFTPLSTQLSLYAGSAVCM